MNNSCTRFEAHYAGIISTGQVNTGRLYTAYQCFCKKKRLAPVSEVEFHDTGNRIIVGLRDWWAGMYTGIRVDGSKPS